MESLVYVQRERELSKKSKQLSGHLIIPRSNLIMLCALNENDSISEKD